MGFRAMTGRRTAAVGLGWAVICLAGLLAAGCAPQLDRIEVSVQENRDEIARLQVENRRLMTELEAMGQLLRMDRDAGSESTAMRLAKLSQLSTQMDQLMRRLDDNMEYMRDLSARVDLLATRQGIPTLGEYKPPVRSDDPGLDVLPEEGRAIFDQAELDRNRGNVDLARNGYREFLEKYGNSESADDALYRLGDLAYGERDHETALGYFEDLLNRFPASDFVPAALFKGRASLVSLGRMDEARAMGEILLTEHPDSAEAELLQADIEQE
jgi:TolA-binding protein